MFLDDLATHPTIVSAMSGGIQIGKFRRSPATYNTAAVNRTENQNMTVREVTRCWFLSLLFSMWFPYLRSKWAARHRSVGVQATRD